jgi:hypothetical protein
MTRLAGTIDGMIGVDPHRDTLAAAATDMVGGLRAQTSVSADAAGYRRLARQLLKLLERYDRATVELVRSS